MKRETFIIDFDNTQFEFYLKPNIVEEQKIKQEMVYLLGGLTNLNELDSAITENYEKHINHFKNKYGKEKADEMLNKLAVLDNELGEKRIENEEYIAVFDSIHDNQYYRQFIKLTAERMKISDYAYMKVCKIKPADYDFYSKNEDDLKGLITELRSKKKAMLKESKT